MASTIQAPVADRMLVHFNAGTLNGDAALSIPAAGGFIHPMLGIGVQATPPSVPAASSVYSQWKVKRAGTLRNLVVVQLSESGAGDLAVTVYVNGVASTLTVTCTALGTFFQDVTHAVSVAADDVVEIFLNHTNVGTVTVGVQGVLEYEVAA